MDFRAVGGPTYARHLGIAGMYDDLRHEARVQGLVDFEVFLFGSDTPLGPGCQFRALHGGVVQFVGGRLSTRLAWLPAGKA